MKKYFIGVIILTIVGVCLYVFGTETKQDEPDTYKIGAIIPLTGRAAYLGEPDQNAILLAEKDFSEKYPDRNVEVVIEDSGSDAKIAVAAAQKLISIDHVDAIFVELTGPSLAVAPVAKEAQVPLIYSAFTDSPLKDNAYALKTFIDYRTVCSDIAQHAKRSGVTKVASLGDATELESICAEELGKVLGTENVLKFSLKPESDVRTEILKLKNEKVEMVVSANFEKSVIQILGAMKEISFTPTYFCNTQNCAGKVVQDAIGTENMSHVVHFGSGVSNAFIEKYNASYPVQTASSLQTAAFDYNVIIDLSYGLTSCNRGDSACVVSKVQSNILDLNAVESSEWKNRVVIPVLDYSTFVDGNTRSYTLSQ